jgi:hypothetical protein
MAKRFICRLFLVTEKDGRIRVVYHDPGDEFIVRPVDLIGPAPLELPDGPQTQEEHDAWLFSVLRPNGRYTMRISASRALDLPPIEEEVVPDAEGVEVEAELEPHRRGGQRTTVLVRVRNKGGVPVRDLSVHWVFENETAQPRKAGGVVAMEVGGSVSLLRSDQFPGTLPVGMSTPFLLDERTLNSVLSQVAALSPERYGISIRSGEGEVLRLPGRVVGAFLMGLSAN